MTLTLLRSIQERQTERRTTHDSNTVLRTGRASRYSLKYEIVDYGFDDP